MRLLRAYPAEEIIKSSRKNSSYTNNLLFPCLGNAFFAAISKGYAAAAHLNYLIVHAQNVERILKQLILQIGQKLYIVSNVTIQK